jgi:pimeloyl-ACP methyl ester carboxylesterase
MRSSLLFGLALISMGLVGCGSDDDAAKAAAPTPPPFAPTTACDDAIESLYKTPADLPAYSSELRGKVLGCSKVQTITEADVKARLASVPSVTVASGDIDVYLIAFRTERDPGTGGISTAMVYLPRVALAEQVPTVVVAHGTVGLADTCAPSRMVMADPGAYFEPWYFDALQLVWAAQGLPVIDPDYAGLGTDGTHSYFEWADPARAVLDGARALRSMLPAAHLDGTTLVSGHSQGGGVAFATAAYAAEAPDVNVKAIVAFAPGYRVAAIVDVFRLPKFKLTPSLRTAASLALTASILNSGGTTDDLRRAFRPEIADRLIGWVDTLCYDQLSAALDTPSDGYVPPANVDAMLDPTFRSALIDCADKKGPCDTLMTAMLARDAANDPHVPAGAPPILVVGSEDDDEVSTGALGCSIDVVLKDGVTPEVCMYSGPDHHELIRDGASYAIDWAMKTSRGETRPACPGVAEKPGCSLF